ncbi:hypothetical protein ACOI1H_17895 [Loktanella sp. DJP18]|uniref:hypothetical protein n=1 Tax=Loktanella sp. DJP18 TaxID=3409788 RepID=UPI003BB7DED4
MKALNLDTVCKIAYPFSENNYHDVAALIATLGLAGTLSEDAILMRIPEHAPTHSDNMRPPVPGYPPTGDALP